MKEKILRLWATKNKNDEWWSSFITSPLAIFANYWAVDMKWLTPNMLTAASFFVALASVVLIAFGGTVNFFIAAILIQVSHVLDCMDGQMARYRGATSLAGSFLDKVTDQIQVTLWFGVVGYAAYKNSHDVLPVFLAFTGVAFYHLRGYSKYAALYEEVKSLHGFLNERSLRKKITQEKAGLGFSFIKNLTWFVCEQPKILTFDEGVFVFMLSFALITETLMPMLYIFAISQVFYGLYRSCQRTKILAQGTSMSIKK